MKHFVLLALAFSTTSPQLVSASSESSYDLVLARSFDNRLVLIRPGWDAGEKVQLREVRTKKILRSFAASDSVTAAAFSRDGAKLVIAEGGFDNIVLRIWNTKSGRLKRVLYEPHYLLDRQDHTDNWSVDLAFTLDGETLINGTYYGIRVWDWKKKRIKRSIPVSFLNYMLLSPDGKTIQCAGSWIEGNGTKDGIRTWSTRNWKRLP